MAYHGAVNPESLVYVVAHRLVANNDTNDNINGNQIRKGNGETTAEPKGRNGRLLKLAAGLDGALFKTEVQLGWSEAQKRRLTPRLVPYLAPEQIMQMLARILKLIGIFNKISHVKIVL